MNDARQQRINDIINQYSPSKSWMTYINLCFPEGLDPNSVQYRETHKAFLAGQLSSMMIANLLLSQALSQADTEAVLNALVDSLIAETEQLIKEGWQ